MKSRHNYNNLDLYTGSFTGAIKVNNHDFALTLQQIASNVVDDINNLFNRKKTITGDEVYNKHKSAFGEVED